MVPSHVLRHPPSMNRMLLAEDNRINQVVAAGVLKKLGYEADIVDDGRAAVEACADGTYLAVLMDVMMPGVDGYEATRYIRDRERVLGRPGVPIIGLSARAMDGDRQIAIDAGMNDYITKPLRTQELAEVLDRWIGPALVGGTEDRMAT
jgi:CheY-like chemotaxis protein